MFHLNVTGVETTPWLYGYDGNEYSNEFMGKWFQQYPSTIQIYLLFVNHPVHPV